MLTAVFGAALAVRLLLALWIYPAQGFAADLAYFETWATEMLAAGPGAIYGTDPQINYPPGYLDVLWGLAWVARAASQTFGTGYADTLAVLLKLPAIAADLGSGMLVYVLAGRLYGHRAGVGAAALILFIPVTWYDSAVWGQVDSISAFLMLGSLTLLVLQRDIASSVAAATAVLVKPQAVIVLLVVAAVLVRRHALSKQRPWVLLAAPAAVVSTLTLVALPFDVGLFAPDRLRGIPVLNELGGLYGLFQTATQSFTVLTANAYNLWVMVGPRPLDGRIGQFDLSSWTADSLPVLWGVPASTLGAVVLATTMLIVAVGLLVRDDHVAILLGFTVVAMAFFAEPTRVHERYLFPAFLTAAVLASGGLVRVAAYVVSGVLTTINLHGILGTAFGSLSQGDGRAPVPQEGARQLPWSTFGRAPWLVDSIAVAQTLTMAALLTVWLVVVRRRPTRRTEGAPQV